VAKNIRKFKFYIMVFFLLSAGCSPGKDSWNEYANGGLYPQDPPNFSPDGLHIVFSSPRTGHGDIVRASYDGSNCARLTKTNDYEGRPIYSPTGKSIAYMRETSGYSHVWIMSENGLNQIQLTSGRVIDNLVGFSKDAQFVFFSREKPTIGLAATYDLYSVSINGGEPVLSKMDLSELRSSALHDATPKGKISVEAIQTNELGYSDIYIKEEISDTKRLLRSNAHSPVISHDGKSVYFLTSPASREFGVVKTNESGGQIFPLPSGYKTVPEISPDGKRIAIGVFKTGSNYPTPFIINLSNFTFIEIICD